VSIRQNLRRPAGFCSSQILRRSEFPTLSLQDEKLRLSQDSILSTKDHLLQASA
jgi:hypothetical protein